MKIAIVGPSKLESLAEINKKYKEIMFKLVEIVAEGKHEIFITPDKGSSSEFFGQEYKKLGGKIFELLPMDDNLGYSWVNTSIGEHINCGTWRNQPEKLNDETKLMICLGYGAGVLAEFTYTKWLNPKPIFVVKDLVSGEMPKELNRSLDFRYLSLGQIEKELKKL